MASGIVQPQVRPGRSGWAKLFPQNEPLGGVDISEQGWRSPGPVRCVIWGSSNFVKTFIFIFKLHAD